MRSAAGGRRLLPIFDQPGHHRGPRRPQGRGHETGLLSNAGPDSGSYFRRGPLGDFFEAYYVSGEIGLLKPQPEIYQHVLGDLGISAAEAVFTDDRGWSRAAARSNPARHASPPASRAIARPR
jgi:FMN phosphatase YigB (HAD superfamily)